MSEFQKNGDTMSDSLAEEQALPPSEKGTSVPAGKGAASGGGRGKAFRCVGAILFALIFLLAGIMAGWFIGVNSVDERARNLAWLLERVADNYYKEVDDEELYDRVFSALELDRFCTYYNVDEYDRVVSESHGDNEGYGVSVTYEGDAVRLYRTIYNSPAEKAGLEAGMYIYRFGPDAENLTQATSSNFISEFSSMPSATLEAGFGEGEKALYNLSRAAYSAAYCEYCDSEADFRFRGGEETVLENVGEGISVLGANTAYIRLAQFEGNAAREFGECLKMMKSRGRTDLVLDLRLDGGGYLSALCGIASHLLKNAEGKSPLVATARYRNGREEVFNASGNDYGDYFTPSSRIRVLADENTASASEALIGAMLCYGTISAGDVYLRVSTLNGEKVAKTYGKGVMQSTYTAPDGRALRLTVAQIFWPDGETCIHDVGIRAEGGNAVEADLFASAEDFIGALNRKTL